MPEATDPASLTEPEWHSDYGRIMGLFEQWYPPDTLAGETRAALDRQTEFLSLKAVKSLPPSWPDHPGWPPLRDWVVDPPVRVPLGTGVSFMCVESEERLGFRFDFTHTCVVEFEFATPSDGTFRHSITLTSPRTAGLPSLNTLRVLVQEHLSHGDKGETAGQGSILGGIDRPRFDTEALQRFSRLLDDLDDLILRIVRPSSEPVKPAEAEQLSAEQLETFAYWEREEIRQVVESAYEAGREVREAELRARFEEWALADREAKSAAGTKSSRRARKLANDKYETILEMALAYRSVRSSPPNNDAIYKYIGERNPFTLGPTENPDKIERNGMPGRQYFEKIMRKVRKDPRWVRTP